MFLHVLAAIGIVGGGIVQVMAGFRIRSATRGSEVATWARFARDAGWIILVAAVLSLMTGGHLAGALWGGDAGGFSNPFISLGAAGLLLLAPIGPMVGGARLRRLIEATKHAESLDSKLRAQATSPGLWGPVHSLVGVGIGEVALMIYKPGWAVGTALLLGTFAVGWLFGSFGSKSTTAH